MRGLGGKGGEERRRISFFGARVKEERPSSRGSVSVRVFEQDADDSSPPPFRFARQFLVRRLGHFALIVDFADRVHPPKFPLAELVPLVPFPFLERALEVLAPGAVVPVDVEVFEVEFFRKGGRRGPRRRGRRARTVLGGLFGRYDAVPAEGVVELGVGRIVDGARLRRDGESE